MPQHRGEIDERIAAFRDVQKRVFARLRVLQRGDELLHLRRRRVGGGGGGTSRLVVLVVVRRNPPRRCHDDDDDDDDDSIFFFGFGNAYARK